MATFTSEEVTGLREGGNERAKEVYFKEWDSRSVPDNCNIEGLRKFIKHVYVDRRYTGEKKSTIDGPSTPKRVEREDSFTLRSGCHGMPCLDIYEPLCIERSGSSGRSGERNSRSSYGERINLGHGKESKKHGDPKRISAYFEVVDDRFRDDISETTKPEANWFSSRIHYLHRRPSNQHKALDSSRPREVRSLRDILDRIPSLRPSEALKEDGGRPSDGSIHMQRTAPTIKTSHTKAYSMEPRRLNSMGYEKNTLGSPVNISSDHEPASQAKQSPKSTGQSTSKPISSPNSNNLVSIDCPTQKNQSKAASNAKNLDSVAPAAKPMGSVSKKPSTGGVLTAEIPNMPRTPSSNGVSPAAPLSNALTSLPTSTSPNPKASLVSAGTALSVTTIHGGSSSEANHLKQEKGIPLPQCSIFPDTASQSTSPVASSSPNLQSSQFVPRKIPQASSGVVTESLPSVLKLSGKKEFQVGHGTGPAVISYSGPTEQKSGGRKELPQHLFVATHSSAPVQSPGWQAVQAHFPGYGLQCSSTVQVPIVHQPANTFDLKNGTHIQSPMLSSMASWHWVQPSVTTSTNLLKSSSLDSPFTQWMPAQSSPYGAVPFQPLKSTSGMPSSSYIGQQLPNKPPPAGTLNPTQHPGGKLPTPAIRRSSSSVGGNPFA